MHFYGLDFSHRGYEVSLLNNKTFGFSDYKCYSLTTLPRDYNSKRAFFVL